MLLCIVLQIVAVVVARLDTMAIVLFRRALFLAVDTIAQVTLLRLFALVTLVLYLTIIGQK